MQTPNTNASTASSPRHVCDVSRWSYTNSPAVTHLGPMAQDFRSAFHLGEDAQHIGVVDGIGVSLAAFQGLNARLEAALEARDTELATQIPVIGS